MQTEQIPELQLGEQALQCDRTAYAEIINRDRTTSSQQCFAVVRDEDVAEDAAQETRLASFRLTIRS